VGQAYDDNNEMYWQILGAILNDREERDTTCVKIMPTSHSDALFIRDQIMPMTHQELAYFGLNKCYQYAKFYLFWYSI
jgi:hypothetical protein